MEPLKLSSANEATYGLSACILTKDSARRIRDCLRSVAELASEIVIVDQESYDSTVDICRRFGARIIRLPRDEITRVGFGSLRKSAISEARNEWIIMIDSDEVLSPELATNVQSALRSRGPYVGYRIYTVGMAFGKPRRILSGYSAFPRLFRKDYVTFNTQRVHEGIVIRNGVLGRLAGPLLHYTYDSWEDVLRKINLYSELQSKELTKDRCSFGQEFISVCKGLFWSLFMQRGISDGITGLKIAQAGTKTRMIAYDKARQRWLSKPQ